MAEETTTQKIARLNDECRQALGVGHVFIQTRGVSDLPEEMQSELREKIEKYTDFHVGNDPHEEHDFGAIEHKGFRFFWKFDYYDLNYEYGSEDPSDPEQTRRVLTLMFASEY